MWHICTLGGGGSGNHGGVPHIWGDYSGGHLGDMGDYKFLTSQVH